MLIYAQIYILMSKIIIELFYVLFQRVENYQYLIDCVNNIDDKIPQYNLIKPPSLFSHRQCEITEKVSKIFVKPGFTF